jgi:hypothetical protein
VVTDVFTVTTTDGGSATVTITITGTNDVASLTSDTKALTETDAALSTSGTLTLTDADTPRHRGRPDQHRRHLRPVQHQCRRRVDLRHHQRPRSARRWPGGDRQLHRHHRGGSATVTVIITGSNDVPTAAADAATTAEDTPVFIDTVANDFDVDSNALTLFSVTQGAPAAWSGIVGGTALLHPTPTSMEATALPTPSPTGRAAPRRRRSASP